MEVSLSLVKNKKGGIKSMKKRILALLMALVMVFGLNTTFMAEPGDSATVDNKTVEVPTTIDVEWNDDWTITLNHVGADATHVTYDMSLYKDGEYVEYIWDFWWGEDGTYTYDFSDYIDGTGEYQVKVNANYYYSDLGESYYVNGTTEVAKYTQPEKVLATPTNVKMENGVVTYDAVEGTSKYLITCYIKSLEYGDMYTDTNVWYLDGTTGEFDVADYISGYYDDYDVYVTVKALSEDINAVANSAESAMVGPYEYRTAKATATIKWSAEELGALLVDKLSDSDNYASYYFSLTKDGVAIGGDYNYGFANEEVKMNFVYYLRMYGSGAYLAELEAAERDDDNKVTTYTAESTYNYAPANKLAAPGNVTLSKDYQLTFNTVEGAEYYVVYMRYEQPSGYISESDWTYVDVEEGAAQGTCDMSELEEWLTYFKEDISTDIKVSIGVRAITGDVETTSTSDVSSWITIYEKKTTADEAEKALDEALEDIEKNPEAAHNVLVTTPNEVLVELMKDADFLSKVVKAETAYVEAMKITQLAPVSSVAAIDASKITVVGAALNAGFADDVQLTVSKPTKEVSVPTGYKNALQLDINLLISGEAMEDLDVPVTITMPIPTGVDTKNLVILHYHGDATEPTVITPVVNADGTMTFTVTGFSTFVIANSVASPGTNDVTPVAAVCGIMLLAAAVVVMRKRNLVK